MLHQTFGRIIRINVVTQCKRGQIVDIIALAGSPRLGVSTKVPLSASHVPKASSSNDFNDFGFKEYNDSKLCFNLINVPFQLFESINFSSRTILERLLLSPIANNQNGTFSSGISSSSGRPNEKIPTVAWSIL
jgi:hypothetical protein